MGKFSGLFDKNKSPSAKNKFSGLFDKAREQRRDIEPEEPEQTLAPPQPPPQPVPQQAEPTAPTQESDYNETDFMGAPFITEDPIGSLKTGAKVAGGIAGGAAEIVGGLVAYGAQLGGGVAIRSAEEGVPEGDGPIPGTEMPLMSAGGVGQGTPEEYRYADIDSLGMPVQVEFVKEAQYKNTPQALKDWNNAVQKSAEGVAQFFRDFPSYAIEGDDWQIPTEKAIEVEAQKATTEIASIPIDAITFIPKKVGDTVAQQTGNRMYGDMAELAMFSVIHKGVASAKGPFKAWAAEKLSGLTRDQIIRVKKEIARRMEMKQELQGWNLERTEPVENANGAVREYYKSVDGKEISVYRPNGISESQHFLNLQGAVDRATSSTSNKRAMQNKRDGQAQKNKEVEAARSEEKIPVVEQLRDDWKALEDLDATEGQPVAKPKAAAPSKPPVKGQKAKKGDTRRLKNGRYQVHNGTRWVFAKDPEVAARKMAQDKKLTDSMAAESKAFVQSMGGEETVRSARDEALSELTPEELDTLNSVLASLSEETSTPTPTPTTKTPQKRTSSQIGGKIQPTKGGKYVAKGRRVFDPSGRMVAEGSPEAPFTLKEAKRYAYELNKSEGRIPQKQEVKKKIGREHRPPKGQAERRKKDRRSRSAYQELQVPDMETLTNDLMYVREQVTFRTNELVKMMDRGVTPDNFREISGLQESVKKFKESEKLLLERQKEILQGKKPRPVVVQEVKGSVQKKTKMQEGFEKARAERGAVPRSTDLVKNQPPKKAYDVATRVQEIRRGLAKYEKMKDFDTRRQAWENGTPDTLMDEWWELRDELNIINEKTEGPTPSTVTPVSQRQAVKEQLLSGEALPKTVYKKLTEVEALQEKLGEAIMRRDNTNVNTSRGKDYADANRKIRQLEKEIKEAKVKEKASIAVGTTRQVKNGKTQVWNGKRWVFAAKEVKKITPERAKKVQEERVSPKPVTVTRVKVGNADASIYPDIDGKFADGSSMKLARVTADGDVVIANSTAELLDGLDPKEKAVYQATSSDSMGYSDVEGRFVSFNELKEVGNDFKRTFEKKFGPEKKHGLENKTAPEEMVTIDKAAEAIQGVEGLDWGFNSEFLWQAEINGWDVQVVKEKGMAAADVYADGVNLGRYQKSQVPDFMRRFMSEEGSAMILNQVALEMHGLGEKLWEIWEEIGNIVKPTKQTEKAKRQAGIMREWIARSDQRLEALGRMMDHTRKVMDRWSKEKSTNFIDAIESNDIGRLPLEQQVVAKQMRYLLDKNWLEVRNLSGMKTVNEYFFPHYWDTTASKVQAYSGKRPLTGPKQFSHERVYDKFVDGLKDDMVPLSWNPVDQFMWKMNETSKFIAGKNIWLEMKNSKTPLVKYVPNQPGLEPPKGWIPLEDSVSKVFAPFNQGKILVEVGKYYAPPEVARLFNNYLSPGWHGRSNVYDFVRGANNYMTMAQLSLSGFHLTFVTLDAMGNKILKGAERIMVDKEFLGGIKDMITGFIPGVAAVDYYRKGKKFKESYIGSAYPDLTEAMGYKISPQDARIIDALIEGGGGVAHEKYFGMRASSKFAKARVEGRPIATIAHAIPWAVEWGMSWMFGPKHGLVPNIKFGIFKESAEIYIRRMEKLGITPRAFERRKAFGDMWDHVDNRLGMLRYDNLFWSGWFKDLNMALFRAVGWNVGTLREIGGGVVETVKLPYTIPKNIYQRSKMTTRQKRAYLAEGGGLPVDPRVAYVVSLASVVMTASKMLEAVYTREMPQLNAPDSWDSFAKNFMVRTGRKNPDGTDEYIVLASYLKDVVSLITSGAPAKMVAHKIGPLWQALGELFTNRDFGGQKVVDTNPNNNILWRLGSGAIQGASHFAEVSTPFSLTNAKRRSLTKPRALIHGYAPAIMGESLIGLTPAIAASIRSPAINYANEEKARVSPDGPYTKLEVEKREKRQIARALAGQGVSRKEVVAYCRENQIKMDVAKKILQEAKKSPIARAATNVPLHSIVSFWNLCTPEEKTQVRRILRNRIKASKTLTTGEKREMISFIPREG